MPSKRLPPPSSFAEPKRRAKELQRLHRAGRRAAAARILAHHPRIQRRSVAAVLARPLSLSDAQLVVAREHGFQDWPALKHHLGAARRVARFRPHPAFGAALAALDAGDVARLRARLDSHPELARARTNLDPPYGYFTGATLLHHVAWNPGRDAPVPANVVEMARLLLDRGALVDALTLGPSAGSTMGLIITSRMASEANVSGPLMDLLLERGASLDLRTSLIPVWGDRDGLDVALSNHATRAAEKLIELGAKPDVCSVAALGRMDLLRGCFDGAGRLRERPLRRGKRLSERDAIGLALLFAYVNKRSEAVDFLLEKDGNWDMTGVNNGTALHRAAWDGDLPMVRRLVAKGADIGNRDNPFVSTPLSWAQHNKQVEVMEWMRKHCAVDIHDAVGFDFREQVVARLREDPACVNQRLDHWDAPRSTPLYWAAWTKTRDVDGERSWDERSREELVRLLLDHGADPNLVAGDGYTPLDVATTAGAERIVALIRERGGKRSADLPPRRRSAARRRIRPRRS